ncbi:DUF192 domain-containing protein [Bacteroidota bacterium]
MKKKYLLILALLFVLVIVLLIFILSKPSDTKSKSYSKEKYKLESTVVFKSADDILSVLWVEVAETPYEHSKGLMYRNYMPDSVGMLFIYPGSEERSYWMQNTRISLDIIYISDEMKIVSAYEFTIPYSEDGLPSHEACKYVIETNAGYMDEHRIEVGDRIVINNL